MGFVSWDLNNFMSAACQKVCELSFRSAIGQQLVIHVQKKKLSLKSDQYHQKMMALEQKITSKIPNCQILPDHRSNDLPSARSQRSTSNDMPHAKSDFEIPSKMRNHINQIINWPATWLKTSLLGSMTDTWSNKTHFWYLPFPPLLFLPPLSFSSISRDPDPRVKGVCGGDYP